MEEERSIRVVGNYRFPQAEPEDCKVCHSAKWATVLVNGICLDCIDNKYEETWEELREDLRDHRAELVCKASETPDKRSKALFEARYVEVSRVLDIINILEEEPKGE
ncbi:MAG: hypothetical protein DDT19_00066 [Syntrophomonadaceae bacterium]|nr:hypothetical protein [Bacillota bacterium]